MEPRKEFIFPQEWKRKAVLFAIHARYNNATIAKFFDLTTMWVWKVKINSKSLEVMMKLWQKDPITKEGLTASELPNSLTVLKMPLIKIRASRSAQFPKT